MKFERSFVATAAILALLVAPGVAAAAVRYAEPGVGGANPACPQSDPCDIEEAVEMAAENDEVVIQSGTYMLSDPLSITLTGMFVHGEAGQPRPIVETSGFTGVGVGNTNATLRRLEIRHSGAGRGLSLFGTGEELVVRSTSAFVDAACHLSLAGRLRDTACSTTGGTGAAVRAVMDGAFTNTLRLRNVTAYSAGGHGMLARATGGNHLTVDVKSSILRGAPGSADVRAEGDTAASFAGVDLEHSNYATTSVDAFGSVTPAGAGTNQTAAPLLADQAGGDFHQLAGSPTINKGVVDGHSGSTDFDGEPRSQGSAPDIGADEFDQIAPSVTITGGPGEGETITSAEASFSFASNDATATFACRLDGGSFGACSGPGDSHSVSGLANGAHSFSVRATDANGNSSTATRGFSVAVPGDPPGGDPVDTEVEDAKLKAKRKQRQGDKIKVKAKVGCAEACEVAVRGVARVKRGGAGSRELRAKTKRYRLKQKQREVEAGERERVVLKPKGKKGKRKLARAVADGRKTRAKVIAKFTDEAGNEVRLKRKVKLVSRR